MPLTRDQFFQMPSEDLLQDGIVDFPPSVVFFLRLVDNGQQASVEMEQQKLIQEAQELASIFGSILKQCQDE